MRDITMTAPAANTTVSTSTADKRANLLSRQLLQALREQTEAQNRIADQLEELNDRFNSFEAMMYVHMRASSVSLDSIDQSLDEIGQHLMTK